MSKIWLLTDDRMGNVNQLIGIAEALAQPFERREIRYTKWVRLPNVLRGRSLIGVDAATRAALTPPWPDLVLSAGRRSFPVARYIRKQSGFKTKIIQLMNPGSAGFHEADIVVLPAHDHYTGHADNVLTVTGSPHRVTGAKLKSERRKWKDILGSFPAKRIAVIVGGATKNNPFTTEMAHHLSDQIKNLNPGSVLVTTSRRTPDDVVDVLRRELPEPRFFYQFGDAGENPYFGLLAWADEIVVTGDSMSMCSECCAAGVPVFIFAPDDMMSPKHKRFHETLYRDGYAAPLGSPAVSPKGSLNPAFTIAERILEHLQRD